MQWRLMQLYFQHSGIPKNLSNLYLDIFQSADARSVIMEQ